MRQPTWLELVLVAGLVGVVGFGVAGPGIDLPTQAASGGLATDAPTPTTGGSGGSVAGSATDTAADITASPTASEPSLVDTASVEFLIHQRINEIRAGEGANELELNNRLREAARYHSHDMARNGYFAHEAPDGETLANRYEQFGLQCRASAENIARTWYKTEVDTASGTEYYDTPKELARAIVQQWMNSASHRNNIHRSEWTAGGIGVLAVERNGHIKVFATQNFCE